MALATLSIDLVAKLAELQAGMDKAGRISEKTAQGIEAAFGGLKLVAVGVGSAFAAAFSVSGIAAFVKSTVDGIDHLNDLSDATGASVENLSALEDIAARTGTNMEAVGASVIKLNKTLTAAIPDSQQAAALKAIGLSVAELKTLDPAEALLKVSTALAGYTDEGRKARLVQVLFGKSVEEVGPFLKDLAEKGHLNATVTAEQAKAAEKFNQELFQLQKNSTDAARSIVSELVPAMNKLFAQFREGGVLKIAGLEETPTKIDRITTAWRLLSLGVERMGPLSIVNAGPDRMDPRVFKEAQENLARIDAQARVLAKDFNAANKAYDKFMVGTHRPPSEGGGGLRSRTLPSVGNFEIDPKAKADAEKAAKEYEKLASSIGMATTAASLEIVGADKLTELQTQRIKLLEELNNGETKFTASQRSSLQAIADSLPALDAQLQLRRLELQVRGYSAKLSDQAVADLQREKAARVDGNNALREQLEEFGKTAQAIEQMRIARLEDKAAQEELTIIGLQNIEGTEAETDARQLNAKALRDQIALRRQLAGKEADVRLDAVAGAQRALEDYVKTAQEAGIATQQAVGRGLGTLEDDLTNSLRKGKGDVHSFVDYALNELIRLQVVRPLLGGLSGVIGGGGFDLTNAPGLWSVIDGFHATGLDRVPFDNYRAVLHKDERVLTASQARSADAGGKSIVVHAPIQIQGDVSENNVALIQGAVAGLEARMTARYG